MIWHLCICTHSRCPTIVVFQFVAHFSSVRILPMPTVLQTAIRYRRYRFVSIGWSYSILQPPFCPDLVTPSGNSQLLQLSSIVDTNSIVAKRQTLVDDDDDDRTRVHADLCIDDDDDHYCTSNRYRRDRDDYLLQRFGMRVYFINHLQWYLFISSIFWPLYTHNQ